MPKKTIIHIISFFVVLLIIIEYKYDFATIKAILQFLPDVGGDVGKCKSISARLMCLENPPRAIQQLIIQYIELMPVHYVLFIKRAAYKNTTRSGVF